MRGFFFNLIMSINIKYESINKHKCPINYHETQLIGELEKPKRKKEEDPRVGNKSKKKKLSCSTRVAK